MKTRFVPSAFLARRQLLLAAPAAVLLAGCAVGPRYAPPADAAPAAFKEAPAVAGWLPAAPGDTLDKGPWWKRFDDPQLDALAERVQVNNQNIAVAVAAYSQAQALVREQRASLLPALTASGSGRRSGPVKSDSGTRPSNSFSAGLTASWDADLWGRLRLSVESASASAQVSQADLAAARLSALGALATNYLQLRATDAEIALLDRTLEGYERSLTITRNRYQAGIAAQTDVLQAQTQLVSARSDRAGLVRDRAVLEHAIAVLVGVAPADFTLAAQPDWLPVVPSVPLSLPAELLQRRPDIAAAERTMARANAQIGIARSAYFPSLNLTASVTGGASRVGELFNASNLLWALGISAAQTVFDGGAIAAQVDAAGATYQGAVASYRQTVLSAFQAVEDQLSNAAAQAEQAVLLRQASEAADLTEQQILNRYRAGQVSYTDVVTAQASALSARRSLLNAQLSRQASAVALIQALGGGWEADWLRTPAAAAAGLPRSTR
ncbi:efflux transporter outer membrane subunit [uncultured Pseudacidovorax sp.]|uniref:efflux transporter outer membrane subunit n=1 Tax=uncultured Pseudacidovorax sp. TaxID=679313 RepID=UPI0025F1F29C|nr:efflux transporter outer membrane subunit [uncultured Pseudacidovorax sp.]